VLNEVKPPVLDESMRTLNPRNAFVMNSLLQEVTRSGTAAARRPALKRTDIYGKTGTTNDSTRRLVCRLPARGGGCGLDGLRHAAQARRPRNRRRPVASGLDRLHECALKGVPENEPAAAEGVVNIGGEWYYEEYANGGGVSSLGLEDHATAGTPNEEERKGILDLFNR
jgi:penicillin-binding protein 1A